MRKTALITAATFFLLMGVLGARLSNVLEESVTLADTRAGAAGCLSVVE
jgi:hypothetical protein